MEGGDNIELEDENDIDESMVYNNSSISLTNSFDNSNQMSDVLQYEEDGTLNNNSLSNSPINTNYNSNNNNVNQNSLNNSGNKVPQQHQHQQQQQQFKKVSNSNTDTIFDIVLQWGSLAISKLCFFPVEFPIHALTTFIQSNHLPPLPKPAHFINLVANSNLTSSTGIISSVSNAISSNLQSAAIGVSGQQHQFLASSLFSLLKQKGYHIYDGGIVYLLHNMITILINFIQRSFNNIQDHPSNGVYNKPFSRNIAKTIDLSLSMVKYLLTLPLDVLMTRLIVHRFYKNNNSSQENITLISLCKNEGVIRGLYSGWEVIVLKSILDHFYKNIDNRLRYIRRGRFSPNDKSPAQIILLGLKLLLDYMLTVIKIRLNIRNIGLLKTVRNIIRREGIYGLFSGLNIYFMLFPLWMISVLVANYIYISFKNLIENSSIPPPPPLQPQNTTPYDGDEDLKENNNGLGVAMSNITELSIEPNHTPSVISPPINSDDD